MPCLHIRMALWEVDAGLRWLPQPLPRATRLVRSTCLGIEACLALEPWADLPGSWALGMGRMVQMTGRKKKRRGLKGGPAKGGGAM